MPIARLLWSDSSKTYYLLAGAAVLLVVALGGGQFWGQEQRWVVTVDEMIRSGDYLHPYFWGSEYYDKPLGSYWLMAIFAKLFGGLNEWAARLPSVLAGLVAVWCTYRLGSRLLNRSTGLLAGWILATSFMFVFWGRVATADMLNLAGTLAAITWYFERKERPGFVSYFTFFLILAVASWMKGLIAPVITILVLIPELLREQNWRQHLRLSLVGAGLLAGIVYVIPFALSAIVGAEHYGESGLWLVFRENFVRYFDAYDHYGPIYTYLQALPLYQFPWSVFLPFAIVSAVRRWKTLSPNSRWIAWALLLIVAFLTGTESRRGYYILPALPFGALMIADWLMTVSAKHPRLLSASGWIAAGASLILLLWFGVGVPYGNSIGGIRPFAKEVRATAKAIAPWPQWRVLCWESTNRGPGFYIRPVTVIPVEIYDYAKLKALVTEHPQTIVLTHVQYLDDLKDLYADPIVIKEVPRVPKMFRTDRMRREAYAAVIPRF
jgi:4-amino-4-deoxy-L-arabinose transferase-like glycosyltransferase